MANQRTNESDRFKKIHPSIFIGLGGTGKHILLTLRRKLFEKYGLKDGFSIMEFLWIDTDMQNIGIDGEKLDFALEQVMFQPDEVVDLQIPESTFNGYIQYKEDYPHIWEWLSHTIEAQGPPKNGAKQIRPLGRLGFFYKYDDIIKKLDFLKNKISSRDNINKTQELGLEVDASKTDIYIVFSIAGGTGSGIFLDMAFSLKDHFTSGINTIGYVVLPAVFWHDKSHRIFANSYAALKELEYYSLRKDFLNIDEARAHEASESQHDFLSWYNAKSTPKKIIGPPFDILYLIDNRTSEGYTINLDNKKQLLDMAAEDIFLQFASPYAFGSIIKSIQSNAHALLEQHYLFEIMDEEMKGEVKYSNAYSRHFASMGLSKIYIPIDKIKRACSLKLAMDIVADWTRESQKDPDINELVEKDFYDHLKLARGEKGKTFINKIDKHGERTFAATVDEWINKLDTRISHGIEKKNPKIRKELTEEYEQFIKENIQDGRTQKGIFSLGIDANVANLVKEIKEGILEKVNEFLNEPEFRFQVSKKVLLHFKDRLTTMKQAMEKECGEIDRKIANRYQPDFNKTLTLYSDVQRRFTYLKKITLLKLGTFLVKKLRTWLIHETRGLLLKGAIKAIDEIIGFVGYSKTEQNQQGEIIVLEQGLVKKLSNVEETLKNGVLDSLKYKYESFARQEEEHINIVLYNESLVKNYYEIDGKPLDDAFIHTKGKEFLAETGREMINFIEYFEKQGKTHLEETLEAFTARHFSAMKRKHEAIKMLYDDKRFNGDERKRMIGNFIGNGHPWIKPTGDFMGTNTKRLRRDMEKYSILGVFPGEHDCYKRFLEDVRSEGVSVDRFQGTDSEENVSYFFTEWVAFPIMYIDGLRQWHDRAYIDFMERGEENLHIEKYYHKYDELIAISREDLGRYLDAYETLILGFILGIIDISEERQRRTFQYNLQIEAAPGFFQQKKLGDEYFAVKRLERDHALRRKISDLIARKKMDFETTDSLGSYYVLLNYYWEHVFPRKFRGSRADPVEIKSFEHRVIEREMQEIGSKIKDVLRLIGCSGEEINRELEQLIRQKKGSLDRFSRRVGTGKRLVLR